MPLIVDRSPAVSRTSSGPTRTSSAAEGTSRLPSRPFVPRRARTSDGEGREGRCPASLDPAAPSVDVAGASLASSGFWAIGSHKRSSVADGPKPPCAPTGEVVKQPRTNSSGIARRFLRKTARSSFLTGVWSAIVGQLSLAWPARGQREASERLGSFACWQVVPGDWTDPDQRHQPNRQYLPVPWLRRTRTSGHGFRC